MPSPHLPLRPGRWLAALLALFLGGPAQAASGADLADQPGHRSRPTSHGAVAGESRQATGGPAGARARLVPGGFPGRLSQPAGSDSQPALRQGRAGPPALVRLIRQGGQPSTPEDAYRVLIDEVPDGSAGRRNEAPVSPCSSRCAIRCRCSSAPTASGPSRAAMSSATRPTRPGRSWPGGWSRNRASVTCRCATRVACTPASAMSAGRATAAAWRCWTACSATCCPAGRCAGRCRRGCCRTPA